MKNLKNLLKKLNFKIIWQVLVGISMIWAATIIIKYSKAIDDESTISIKNKIENLNTKIDSISIANEKLIVEQAILSKKIDSINNLKSIEDEKYKNTVIAINNASIIDDTEWFFSKLDSLKFAKKFSISSRRIN